ncbi:hypothetical protein N7492_010710 [Penicillium capsulatum]|uniref:Uncharacterized protein n=1 Tax=Penicillium capsulatum TaxID=69766 RepID=A0A9W9HPC7_9EURO|nr:hypothetical protein N7492_010710 [Penicillium capsulatum]
MTYLRDRGEDSLDNDLQRNSSNDWGELSGKPAPLGSTSTPSPPLSASTASKTTRISVISSQQRQKLSPRPQHRKQQSARREMAQRHHLRARTERLTTSALDRAADDRQEMGTLWASGYESSTIASRGRIQKFLEGLTGNICPAAIHQVARDNNFRRASPVPAKAPTRTVGDELRAQHPSTGPTPSLAGRAFSVGSHVQKVDGMSEEESSHLLRGFVSLIVENHDLQECFEAEAE